MLVDINLVQMKIWLRKKDAIASTQESARRAPAPGTHTLPTLVDPSHAVLGGLVCVTSGEWQK